jgi:subtilisin family serine protease
MRKIIVTILLISMLALIALPPARSVASSSAITNLKYSVLPVQEQFVEAYAGEPLPDDPGYYLPYDVDLVNGEYFANGGQGVYVSVIDTGLVNGWQNFLPPTATIRTDLGRGWSYDVVWNPGIDDFDWTPNTGRGFITNAVGSGHGTHVTSTIVGYQRSTIGVTPNIVLGVAPKATIIPILGLDYWLVDCPDPNYPGCLGGKVFFGGGDDWMLTSAIYYVAELAETYKPMICTNSWGSSEPSPAIREAIDYAITKGVIFVFSAGNDGTAGMGWPGAYPEVISAAAGGWTMQYLGYAPSNPPSPYRWYLSDVPEKLNTWNNPIELIYGITDNYYDNNWQIYLATFSGRPNPDLGQSWKDLDVCAPGCYVVGPYQPNAAWNGATWVTYTTAYYGLWGTSMAAPHVAGVAAIVAQNYPNFNQADMEQVLKKAANKIPLSSDTKWLYDQFYGVEFPNNDHDAGAGWLTADNAMWVAAHLNSGAGCGSSGKVK